MTPTACRATGILRAEHEVILRALGLLDRLAASCAGRSREDGAARRWLIEFFATYVDRRHHGKEERHLFPALVRCGLPSDEGALPAMLTEHEAGRQLLRAMGASHAAVPDPRYAALMRQHIAKEDTILLSLADLLLPAAEQRALVAAFEASDEAATPGGVATMLDELDHLCATVGARSDG